ncbi:MAG: T9SS type A sorting domain-containing protein [Saprospiraceae bacterium]|jgi:hypothetical protein|nr:T9SS type A sorting domain-containing protein [Saprospiraceae bacterium]
MRKLILLAWLALACPCVYAQLLPGDVMFVAYDSDVRKGFSVVALVDIPAGATIYFSDKRWTGAVFQDYPMLPDFVEGYLSWVNTTGLPVPAGTVIEFRNVHLDVGIVVSHGTVTRIGNFDPGNNTDIIYAYLGDSYAVPSVFLSAIANGPTNSVFYGNLNNTGLENGVNAFRLLGSLDVMIYNGPTVFSGSIEDCARMLSTPGHWVTQNTSAPNDDSDGSFPDFPDDVPTVFSFSLFPIELVYFRADVVGQAVKLSWQTATEQNNDFMAVERSSDGRLFQEIGRLQGMGTSLEAQSYSLYDEQPLAGTNYYRLRQVDYDGTETRYEVVAVTLEGHTGNWRLFPVPAATQVQLVLPEATLVPMVLRVYDAVGRLVLSQQLPEGSSNTWLSISNLSAGKYTLQAVYNRSVVSLPFIKE